LKIALRNELLLINLLNVVLILIVVFLPSSILRVILGIPFVLFSPGYALISAFYPTKDAIHNANRLMLSFALSIAIIPLILLLLNFSSWGIRLNPILYSVATFTAIISVIAWFRRRSRPASDRFIVQFNLQAPAWKGFWKAGIANRITSVILLVVILGAIGTLIYVVKMPRMGEKFTEFYILGVDGKATDYPPSLNLGETGGVTVGIVNHERVTMSYHVEVRVNGVKDNETGAVTLADGETWESIVSFRPTIAATNQKIEFLLFKDGEIEPSMEPLHMWVDVKG
jgi:uncharacterized membrane protein